MRSRSRYALCVERLRKNVKDKDLYLKTNGSMHQYFDRKSPAMVYSVDDIIGTLIRKEYVHP